MAKVKNTTNKTQDILNDVYFRNDDGDGSLRTSLETVGDINVDSTTSDASGLVGKSSGGNFVTAYASGTTIDCTSMPSYHATLLADDIVSIVQVATGGGVTATYTRDDAVMAVTTNTITVTGATFAASDTFVVYTNIAREVPNLDVSNNADRVESTNRSEDAPVDYALVDTTNVSAATHYYPAATGQINDGYKDLSISGKFIDADGTLTLTIEAMDDEDTTSGDWIQVYAYDDKNNATSNSWTVTNGTLTFALSLNNFNYKYWRAVVVASGATNTVIVKGRSKKV